MVLQYFNKINQNLLYKFVSLVFYILYSVACTTNYEKKKHVLWLVQSVEVISFDFLDLEFLTSMTYVLTCTFRKIYTTISQMYKTKISIILIFIKVMIVLKLNISILYKLYEKLTAYMWSVLTLSEYSNIYICSNVE